MKREAYRWTSAQGVTAVPNVSGDTLPSYASGISADGSIAIGARWSGQLGSSDQGFLAPESGPRLDVGDLPGGQTFAGPLGISGDGLTVVGQSGVTKGVEAFRWTSAGRIVGLGDFTNGNRQSAAYAASQDGSVIVGSGMRPSNATAFRWSQSTGMQAVQDLLVEGGIDMQGWNLIFATDVSANGNILVGIGTNPDGHREAWLADFSAVPEPATLVLLILAMTGCCVRRGRARIESPSNSVAIETRQQPTVVTRAINLKNSKLVSP